MQLSLLDWLQGTGRVFQGSLRYNSTLGNPTTFVAGALALPMETETNVIFYLRNLTLVCVWEKERERDTPGIYMIYPLFLHLKNILERNFSTMCLGLFPVPISLHKHRVASVNKTQIVPESRAQQAQEPWPTCQLSGSLRREGNHTSIEHWLWTRHFAYLLTKALNFIVSFIGWHMEIQGVIGSPTAPSLVWAHPTPISGLDSYNCFLADFSTSKSYHPAARIKFSKYISD